MLKNKFLTILVTGLSERFALWENNGNDEILERGDVEETGVLEVLDVVFVLFSFSVVVVRNINVQWQVAGTGWGQSFVRKQLNIWSQQHCCDVILLWLRLIS